MQPHSATTLPVELSKVTKGTDVLILSESVPIRGLRIESGLATVSTGGHLFILVHNLTHGELKLTIGLGSAPIYPSPVRECSVPESFFAASMTVEFAGF